MHFSSSLLSSAILVLAYLTNAALCIPTDEPSKLMVNDNQQPLHSTTGNSTATAIRLDSMIIPWIREGLDPRVNYGVVSGQGAALVKDHFIELQFIRNYILSYTGALSIDAFNTIVQSANSINNVFLINSNLNNHKSRAGLAQYVGDAQIHAYLCSDFTNSRTLVAQRAQAFLNSLINDADPSVRAIGTGINGVVALGTLRCP